MNVALKGYTLLISVNRYCEKHLPFGMARSKLLVARRGHGTFWGSAWIRVGNVEPNAP